MATFSKHSLSTQPKSREKRARLYNNQFQNRRHKQLTKEVTALERSVAKQFATGVAKPTLTYQKEETEHQRVPLPVLNDKSHGS
jgi:radical SAM superfamily enzyme with C-terminal helix-hairpin-helix motif